MRNIKTVLRVLGLLWLGIGIIMGIAQIFFVWSPTTSDEFLRATFMIFGLVCIGLDSFLPG